MRLLRGISRNIPTETLGQPDLGFCWWEADRHHGLGHRAAFQGTSAGESDMSVDLEAPPTGQAWKTPPDLMTVIEDVDRWGSQRFRPALAFVATAVLCCLVPCLLSWKVQPRMESDI